MSEWAEVAAWLAGQADRVIETSCARVFLIGDRALKLKAPVKLPLLDFSTAAKRQWALDRELAFNAPWAPGIYRAVIAVTRAGGALAVGGAGEALEWLLEMRRFDPDAVLANHPRMVDGALADTLGRLIARRHIDAGAAPGVAGDNLGYTIATNEVALRRVDLDGAAGARLIEATRAAAIRLAPVIETRAARHCHGDLHLGNILMEDGAPILFDCIEFNDRLSQIDPLYDVAFPIMDLAVAGRPGPANRLLGAWLDEMAREAGQWAGAGRPALYLSIRAAVRAHVSAATGQQEAAGRYLAAAQAVLVSPVPRLFAIGGLSGSGKTTLAHAVAPLIAGPPGAVVLRSDEIRKRLMGVAAARTLPATAYSPGVDERVYGEMLMVADQVLAAGRSAILDATFLDPAARVLVSELAAHAGVAFTGAWLDGDPAMLRARLAASQGRRLRRRRRRPLPPAKP